MLQRAVFSLLLKSSGHSSSGSYFHTFDLTHVNFVKTRQLCSKSIFI